MKRQSIKKHLYIPALLFAIIILSILAVIGYRTMREAKLNELQNAALEELERNQGTYDEQSIVLSSTSKAKAKELAELFGAELRITSDGRYARLTLPEGTNIRDIYANDDYRIYIEEMSADYSVYLADGEADTENTSRRLPQRPNYTVTDSAYQLQTYLDYLNLQGSWMNYRGSGIIVAVIDTGIDTDHPEFVGRISPYSYNATEDKVVADYTVENGEYDWSLIEDEQGHGTAVSGVIAASMNGDGIVGIAPDATILVIKAECNEKGAFKRSSDLVFGIYYAIEQDVQIINMSFGSSETKFEAPLQLAYDSDIVCVAAAGNSRTAMLTYPAANQYVIGVGAMDEKGNCDSVCCCRLDGVGGGGELEGAELDGVPVGA